LLQEICQPIHATAGTCIRTHFVGSVHVLCNSCNWQINVISYTNSKTVNLARIWPCRPTGPVYDLAM